MIVCGSYLQPVAAQISFYTTVSETVLKLNQTFQVQYTLLGTHEVNRFTTPEFRDFRVEDVFDIPSSSGLNPGVVASYTRIVVLSPRKTGKFMIPGAKALVNGKTYSSMTVQVVVHQTGLAAANMQNDLDTEESTLLQPGEDIDEKIRRNHFLRVEASKTTCYVGEPLMVVFKAYSRLNASSQVVKRPSLTGFSVLEMVDSYDNKPEIETLNGLPYYTNIIRKVHLFPLQEGTFTLDPAEVESVIHFTKVSGNSRTVINYPTTIQSPKLPITVKPLPEKNQPEDFSGAIGHFNLAVQTPKSVIHRGELVKIRVIISGTGNFSLLTAPPVIWPKGVDTADPVVQESVNKYEYPLKGTKSFEYSFAAPDTGMVTIPAMHLPYYDPAEKAYKISSTEPVVLEVKQGLSQKDADTARLLNSGEITSRFPRHLYWFGGVVVIVLGWVIYQAIQLRRNKKTPAEPVSPKVQEPVAAPAPKPVSDGLLDKASVALYDGNASVFFREVQQALWNFAVLKCAVPPTAQNKQTMSMRLVAYGASPAVADEFLDILKECEWALYTPNADVKDMQQLLARSQVVLKEMEKI